MNVSEMRDVGAYIKPVFGAQGTATAAGAGDNTEVDGAWVDRQGFESLVASVGWSATLAAAATLSLAFNLQDASDSSGTGAADFGTAFPATVVATGPGGGGTVNGITRLNFDLSAAKRYVRIQFTPNLSALSADTSRVVAQLILGGPQQVPTT